MKIFFCKSIIWPPQKYNFGVSLIEDIRKRVLGEKKMIYVEKTLNTLKSFFDIL